MIRKVLYLSLALLLFTACNRKADVKGECYITTARGDSITLAGVQVKAINSNAMREHLFKIDFNQERVSFAEIENLHADESTTTDANGKFNMSLPSGNMYFLVARASRPSFSESYFWCVPLDLAGSSRVVALNSDNMADATSAGQVNQFDIRVKARLNQ